ncbi:hypothetical protein ABID82_001257 [Methylobacterium sp. PvP062]|uniref:Uncharacterized protein n=1 Tax=Methylobacterium radiotolerans TaxID=31998 RepID=A0ABV2NFE2_9HYPH|nr:MULTISPECIES: hypothetical protein [Methylobacterium]MCX7334650.1 hypothetical protein [Hyphomicrobiales bacterium]GAN49089.1 hypothetical protein ME121_3111 [Methylobacterium sp. ME121]MBN6819242.1 hypothetical protein [Methylobacterium organophilum]MBP2498053.1 hypothetical protein [Methylobacterium sp. PvP105]MBP2502076.1 hypothetical protein [Methylobacterium sp. PvP109]
MLPQGRFRFLIPAVLLVPLPVVGAAGRLWQRLIHAGEMAAISSAVADLPPGATAAWTAKPLLPWTSPVTGQVLVQRETGSADFACKDSVYSLDGSSVQLFAITLCRVGRDAPWRNDRDGSERWGG